MKKLFLILGFLILTFAGITQSKKYVIHAIDSLITDKLLKFGAIPDITSFTAYSMAVDLDNRTVVMTNDETEIALQLGQELWLEIKNNNGVTFANGVLVYIVGGEQGKPTVLLAHNRDFEKVDAIGMITHDVESGTFGFTTTFGTVGGLNTLGETEGAPVYVDTLQGGKNWTCAIPAFPNHEFQVGFIHTVDNDSGKIFINVIGQVDDILHNINNANAIEPFDFRVASDGATVTGTLSSPTGKDSIVVKWSDGFTKIDVPQQISIPQGTDNDSQTSFTYLQKSTDALAISTTYFPLDEEMKTIAKLETWTATKTQLLGQKGNQNYNDYVANVDTKIGRIQQVGKWQRLQPLKYVPNSGSVGSVTILNVSGKDSVDFALTQGIWSQANEQIFPAYDMATGDDIHVFNWPDHADTTIMNLADALIDATGASMAGDYFTFVTWLVQNKTGDSSHVFMNLPLGSYSQLSDALLDPQGYKVKSIPYEMQSYSGFIYEITLRHTNPGGGTWTLIQLTDIKGDYPFSGGSSQGIGGGITALTQASDFPNSYATFGGYLLQVDPSETATSFIARSDINLSEFGQDLGLQEVTDVDPSTTNSVMIGSADAPASPLHVLLGGSSGQTPLAGTVMTLESNGNSFLSFLTPNSAEGAFIFGDSDSNIRGVVLYNHPNDRMDFRTSGNTTRMSISSTGNVDITGTVTHLAPSLSTESALLSDIEGGSRDGDFNTISLGGADINTAGTLSNIAYENQANVFTLKNIFNDTITVSDIVLDADLIDINDTPGTAGQVLSSLGTGLGVDWVDAAGVASGSGIEVAAGLVNQDINTLSLISGGAVVDGDMFLLYDTSLGSHHRLTGGGLKTYIDALTDPMTTRGDIIYRDATNTTVRLAVGGAGEFLSSDGTDVSWAAPPTSAWTDGGAYLEPTNGEDVRINGVSPELQLISSAGDDWDIEVATHALDFTNTSEAQIYLELDGSGQDIFFFINPTIQGQTPILFFNDLGDDDLKLDGTDGAFLLHNTTDTRDLLNVDGGGSISFDQYGSGTWTGTAAYNLEVTAGGLVIETTAGSDFRMKENFRNLNNSLDKILSINTYAFDWQKYLPKYAKDIPFNIDVNSDFNERESAGVIAQEIMDIIPEAVKQYNNGYYKVDYEVIVPHLIEAIKEQQKQIEELKSLIK